MKKRWYVAKVKYGQDAIAEVELVKQGFYPWFPRLLNGELLFPGYALIAIDLNEQHWKPINSTNGIERLLPIKSERPLPLPDAFVPELQAFLATEPSPLSEGTGLFEQRYTVGDNVLIASGPLAGKTGKYQRKKKGAVEVLLSCLGRETILYVPAHQLSPAGPPKA